RRHTRFSRDWSSDVCSSDLVAARGRAGDAGRPAHARPVAGLQRAGRDGGAAGTGDAAGGRRRHADLVAARGDAGRHAADVCAAAPHQRCASAGGARNNTAFYRLSTLWGGCMNVLYLLVPLAIVLAAVGVAAFLWAVRNGQFDDVETPALR